MTTTLIKRIDETRKKWVKELEEARNGLLDHRSNEFTDDRLMVEYDCLIVEAKIRIVQLEAEKNILIENGIAMLNESMC